MKIIKLLFIVSLTLTSSSIFARSQKGPPRNPPKEAISICVDKEAGSTCSIENREGKTMTGTCENTPDGKYFACKPERR